MPGLCVTWKLNEIVEMTRFTRGYFLPGLNF